MTRPWKIGIAALAIILAFTTAGGCGSKSPEASGGSQETEAGDKYNQTKSMVLDILHTKEGMEALKDIVRYPLFKQSLAINETDVQIAMQKALTDGSSHVTLMEQMRNPKFAVALAKAYQKDNERILKELMRDPEYQKMMFTLLKSPEFSTHLYDLMKTPEYRKQTMSIMTQALQNPQFRLMFMELIKEAIRQGTTERTPSEKKMSGQEGGGGEGEKKKEGGEEGEKKKEGGEEDKEKEKKSGESGGGEGEGGGGQ